jgi:hypothetical protein
LARERAIHIDIRKQLALFAVQKFAHTAIQNDHIWLILVPTADQLLTSSPKAFRSSIALALGVPFWLSAQTVDLGIMKDVGTHKENVDDQHKQTQ